MCNVPEDEFCAACADVAPTDPYYGQCLACGNLDPRGAPAKAAAYVLELEGLLQDAIAQCYTKNKPMQDPLHIRITQALTRDRGQGN
jgi:hypothetical protein